MVARPHVSYAQTLLRLGHGGLSACLLLHTRDLSVCSVASALRISDLFQKVPTTFLISATVGIVTTDDSVTIIRKLLCSLNVYSNSTSSSSVVVVVVVSK